MPYLTLPDASRPYSTNAARTQADQAIREVTHSITLCFHRTEVSQPNDSVIIDGVLRDDGLTVFLRSPDSRRTLRETSCVRFDAQELPKIGDVPDHSNRFCDISAGETSEGLTLVIESHRCYAADSQGNASTLKV